MVLTDTNTKTRNQNRKATAIAATFRALDLDHYEAGRLSDTGWKLAARAAWLALPADERPATQWTDASMETRQLVADQLRFGPPTTDAIFAAAKATAPPAIRDAATARDWWASAEMWLRRRHRGAVMSDYRAELWDELFQAGHTPVEAVEAMLAIDEHKAAAG